MNARIFQQLVNKMNIITKISIFVIIYLKHVLLMSFITGSPIHVIIYPRTALKPNTMIILLINVNLEEIYA